MGFLDRLFAPEIAALKLRLDISEKQTEWFRERCDELGKERLAAIAKYEREVKRNREREDELTNTLRGQIGRPLPKRDVVAVAHDQPDAKLLDTLDEQVLRSRAVEILEQQGVELTVENIEKQYQEMLGNSEYWLEN